MLSCLDGLDRGWGGGGRGKDGENHEAIKGLGLDYCPTPGRDNVEICPTNASVGEGGLEHYSNRLIHNLRQREIEI